jgi:hypothetical protein
MLEEEKLKNYLKLFQTYIGMEDGYIPNKKCFKILNLHQNLILPKRILYSHHKCLKAANHSI